MKYRIKEIIYKSGNREYIAQVKKLFVWVRIYHNGEEAPLGSWTSTLLKSSAEERILLHKKNLTEEQGRKVESVNIINIQ